MIIFKSPESKICNFLAKNCPEVNFDKQYELGAYPNSSTEYVGDTYYYIVFYVILS